MKTLLERMNLLQQEKAKSVRSLAISIGCNQVSLNNQLTGKRGINIETILAILETYKDISAEWLLRGEGSMYKSANAGGINIHLNKVGQVGDGSAVAQGDGATATASDDAFIIKENARLREENKKLRERCDKLTDKLLEG